MGFCREISMKTKARVNVGLLSGMETWWQRIWKGTSCAEGSFTSVFPGKAIPRNVTPVGKFGKEAILWQGSLIHGV